MKKNLPLITAPSTTTTPSPPTPLTPAQRGTGGPTHEWVTFKDDHGKSWRFDVKFLSSNFECIWGRGCKGIGDEPIPDGTQSPLSGDQQDGTVYLGKGCCDYGVTVDKKERKTLLKYAARLTDDEWENKKKVTTKEGKINPNKVFTLEDKDGLIGTRRTNNGCIFLNSPGFDRPGCALHLGAIDNGEDPLDWKPYASWTYPLIDDPDYDDERRQGHIVTASERKYTRDGGESYMSMNGWFCTNDPATYQGKAPLYKTMERELRRMAGDNVYEQLAAYLATRIRQEKASGRDPRVNVYLTETSPNK